MEITLILAVTAFCILLIYLAFKLNEVHKYYKLFILGILVWAMVLLPKAAIDTNDHCDLVLNGTHKKYVYSNNFTGIHWDYDEGGAPSFNNPNDPATVFLFHEYDENSYRWECFTNDKGTADTLYKISIWFAALSFIYLFGYFVAWKAALEPMIRLVKKR